MTIRWIYLITMKFNYLFAFGGLIRKTFLNAYIIDESKREKMKKEGGISVYKGFEDMGLNY
jgi:hypothetical protein